MKSVEFGGHVHTLNSVIFFVTLFVNNFCSGAEHIIMLKEATANCSLQGFPDLTSTEDLFTGVQGKNYLLLHHKTFLNVQHLPL